MRKYLSLLFLFCSVSLFAAEFEYPATMNNGTILMNIGIGFGMPVGKPEAVITGTKKTEVKFERVCPPLTISFDYALPIAGLPLTIGLITGYFSEKTQNLVNYWPVAGRIGYHLSLNVPHLDPYLLLTLGGISSDKDEKFFWFGLSGGARYFFLPSFGAYAELGFETVQILTFGIVFNL